jgi:arginase
MLKFIGSVTAFIVLASGPISAQNYLTDSGKIRVLVVKDPYSDSRTGPELLKGPERLATEGLTDVLERTGCVTDRMVDVKMPPESEREYGEWNRASLTNRVLNKSIAAYDKDEVFVVGLLSGSKSVTGMLAGLQHMGPGRSPLKDSMDRDISGLVRLGEGRPLTVGLVWIDSKGSFHTPDTTLEGDMGGMNVAVAAGRSNSTLRLQAGLDPPLSTKYIVMAGLQNMDPYEQVEIHNTFIETLSVNDLESRSENIAVQMKRLSRLTDIIYVHVDLSVLDPAEVPGHPQAAAKGPTSTELAACLEAMFQYPKAAAIGIASLPDDAEEVSLNAAYRLLEGALRGVKSRPPL